MADIKIADINVDELVSSDELFGQKVLDNRGKEVGKVKKVHINPLTFFFEGITLDQGLFRDKDFVESSYIASISENGVILMITPITQYLGLEVVDSNGKSIGKVKDVKRVRKTNCVLNITVDRGMNEDDLIISDKFIDNVGEKIMLNYEVK